MYCSVTFWVCGNSSRQIPSLHSVSVSTVFSLDAGVILSLTSFIRTAALLHVLIFDVLPPTPLLSHLEGDHYHPGDFTRTSPHPSNSPLPPSSTSSGSDRSLQRCSEPPNILVKESQLPCHLLVYTTVPATYTLLGFVLFLLDSGDGGCVVCCVF